MGVAGMMGMGVVIPLMGGGDGGGTRSSFSTSGPQGAAPYMRSLPHTHEVAKHNKDQGVVVLSVKGEAP